MKKAEWIHRSDLLPEDPAIPMLTRMLVLAPYQAPEKRAKKKGEEAWDHAKRHPVSSTIFTVLGLVLAGAAIWATSHYHLVDRGKDLVGLG